jgi:hypothetical protein
MVAVTANSAETNSTPLTSVLLLSDHPERGRAVASLCLRGNMLVTGAPLSNSKKAVEGKYDAVMLDVSAAEVTLATSVRALCSVPLVILIENEEDMNKGTLRALAPAECLLKPAFGIPIDNLVAAIRKMVPEPTQPPAEASAS